MYSSPHNEEQQHTQDHQHLGLHLHIQGQAVLHEVLIVGQVLQAEVHRHIVDQVLRPEARVLIDPRDHLQEVLRQEVLHQEVPLGVEGKNSLRFNRS